MSEQKTNSQGSFEVNKPFRDCMLQHHPNPLVQLLESISSPAVHYVKYLKYLKQVIPSEIKFKKNTSLMLATTANMVNKLQRTTIIPHNEGLTDLRTTTSTFQGYFTGTLACTVHRTLEN